MVLVHGIHVTAEAQKPVTHALNSLIVFTIAAPGFCLALGLYMAGIGFYMVAGMAIFALATFAEVKKKINLGSREGVSCCSNFFFLLFLTSAVLVIGFMLETVSSCGPTCWWADRPPEELAHSENYPSRPNTRRSALWVPTGVQLIIAASTMSIMSNLKKLHRLGTWLQIPRHGSFAARVNAARALTSPRASSEHVEMAVFAQPVVVDGTRPTTDPATAVPVAQGVVVAACPPPAGCAAAAAASASATSGTRGSAGGSSGLDVGAAVVGSPIAGGAPPQPPTTDGHPPLVTIVDVLQRELHLEGGSMADVCAAACRALDVDPRGKGLLEQAVTCWRKLGCPATVPAVV